MRALPLLWEHEPTKILGRILCSDELLKLLEDDIEKPNIVLHIAAGGVQKNNNIEILEVSLLPYTPEPVAECPENHPNNIDTLKVALELLKAENEHLRAAIRNQAGDNLCWMDNVNVVKIPEKAEFLESCRRYHKQISSEVGVLDSRHMTIAQLEASVQRLSKSYDDLVTECLPPNFNAERLEEIADDLEEHRLASIINAEALRDLREWAKWLREHVK